MKPSLRVLLATSSTLLFLLIAGCHDGNHPLPPPAPPPPAAPDMTPIMTEPLTLGDTKLPEATANVFYKATVTVTGDHAGEAHWYLSQGTLPAGVAMDSTIGSSIRLAGTPTVTGSYSFTIDVRDSAGGHDAKAVTLVVGDALAIDGTLPAATEGENLSATLTARGGHGTTFTWSVSDGALPDGVMLTAHGATAELHGVAKPGTSKFVIALANDAGEQATRAVTLQVVSSLKISHDALPQAVEGRSFSLALSVSGGTGKNKWSLHGSVPSGIALGSATGDSVTLAGTFAFAGTYDFSVDVSDDNLGTASVPLTLVVTPALHIVTSYLPDGKIGAPYSQELTASGGASTDYRWAVTTGALPSGLTLSTGSGSAPAATLSGTPTQTGTYDFTITVSTPSGDRISRGFSIRVGTNPPHIATTILGDATWGTAYDATISGTSAFGGAVTWSVVAGALPPGLTLGASTTPTVALSGTPKLRGTFAFTVKMSDGGGSEERRLSVTVVRRGGIEIAAAILPPARAGKAYSADIDTRGAGGAVTWTVDSGALPSGLQLSGSGSGARLSGTPTTSGWFVFTLRASDAAGGSDSSPFAVRVASPRMYIAAINTSAGDLAPTLRVREIQDRTPGAETKLVSGVARTAVYGLGFSPSGDWLDYQLENGASSSPLYVADLRSTPTAPVLLDDSRGTSSPPRFAWSPDDAHTLTRVARSAGSQYYDLDLGDLSGATPATGKINVDPSSASAFWSPDGTRVAYQSGDGKTFYVHGQGGTISIPMPSNLSGAHVPSFGVNPWLPDSRGFIFIARDSSRTNEQIFYVDATDGAQPLPLSDPGVPLSGGNCYASPDGRGLVFLATGTGDSSEVRWDAWYVDLSTRQLGPAVKISGATSRWIANVLWSPDSRQLLLPIGYGHSPPLAIARDQFGVAAPTALNIGSLFKNDNGGIAWAADSQHVLFRDSSASAGLYELSLTGAAPLFLASNVGSTFASASASKRAYVYAASGAGGGLYYVVAGDGSASTPLLVDTNDAYITGLAVSRTLETIFYTAQSKAVYMVDASGSKPGMPAQLFAGSDWPLVSISE
jgi:hypothetical protein